MLFLDVTTVPDVLAGSAGWVGTGLLGSVLAWLMFVHLPAKDKQVKDLLGEKDSQITSLLDRSWLSIQQINSEHRETIKVMASEFRQSIERVVAHCDEENTRLIALIGSGDKG